VSDRRQTHSGPAGLFHPADDLARGHAGHEDVAGRDFGRGADEFPARSVSQAIPAGQHVQGAEGFQPRREGGELRPRLNQAMVRGPP